MKNHLTRVIVSMMMLAPVVTSCREENDDDKIYFLEIANVPQTIINSEEATFRFTMNSNLPDRDRLETRIESDDWISASVSKEDTRFIDVSVAENTTNVPRTGRITFVPNKSTIAPVTVEISQYNRLVQVPGMVAFNDIAFKTAAVEAADRDGDREVSPEEALKVKELSVSGLNISDLTGIEAFSYLEKLDARDNDIVDANILTNLSYLHWLDLKGNMNLTTFDVTGCSMYFDHCEFECTEQLHYTAVKYQVNVSGHIEYTSGSFFDTIGSDPECEHSTHIDDPRRTTDWSRQNRVYQIAQHTKGEGGNKLVLSGTGYIDNDLTTGTFDRVMREAYETFFVDDYMKSILDYFDVYIVERITEKHNKWMLKCTEVQFGTEEYENNHFLPWANEMQHTYEECVRMVTDKNSEYKVAVYLYNLDAPLTGLVAGHFEPEQYDTNILSFYCYNTIASPKWEELYLVDADEGYSEEQLREKSYRWSRKPSILVTRWSEAGNFEYEFSKIAPFN